MADKRARDGHTPDQRCYYGTGRRPEPPRSHAGLIVLLLALFFGLNLVSFLALVRLYWQKEEPAPATVPSESTESWFGADYDESAILQYRQTGAELDREEVSEKLSASLAAVSSDRESATGLILTEDGYLLVAGRVLEHAATLGVTLADGQHYDADLVGRDAATDFAILKINAKGLRPAELSDGAQVAEGDTLYSVDASDGHITQSRVFETIPMTDGEGNTGHLLRTGLDLRKEEPAAALANKSGQIVALYPGASAEAEGLTAVSGAIPTSYVLGLLNDLIAFGATTGQATLGMEVCALSEAQQSYWSLPAGVAIERIGERGGAYAAGLRPGDVLIRIGGQEICTLWDYLLAVRQLRAGERVEITVYADGEEYTVSVTVDTAGQDDEPYFARDIEPTALTQ